MKPRLSLTTTDFVSIERAFSYHPKLTEADNHLWSRIRQHRFALERAAAELVADKYIPALPAIAPKKGKRK